jgi:dephospho-CoA kinase
MKRIGITGIMGSGKSTVCRIFEVMRIPVFYADDQAKRLMQEDNALQQAITSAFGELYPGGQLDRKALAEQVFGDESKTKQLNELVHPAVSIAFDKWSKERNHADYQLKEAALIFESGSDQGLDEVYVVTAPLEVCIERVMTRDGATRSQVEDRMARQLSQEEKLERATGQIVNDGQTSLIEQVLRIHNNVING